MSAPTLVAAIANEVTSAAGSGDTVRSPQLAAAYVLAMPEMQAMRLTLIRLAAIASNGCDFNTARDVLVNYGLPDHVVDWVLS